MPKATKASQLLTATALTLFSALAAAQQMKEDIRLPEPKRFIDKVEVIAGPSLYFPDDNGWSERVKNNSQGSSTHRFRSKSGYSAGIGLIHSLGKHFEINGRVLWERKGYKSEGKTTGDNNNVYGHTVDTKNDYLTASISPAYLMGRGKHLYIYILAFFTVIS